MNRGDYRTSEWNHIALYCNNNDFTMGVNGYYFGAAQVSSYSQVQKETRFFYNFAGKATEFKLYTGN